MCQLKWNGNLWCLVAQRSDVLCEWGRSELVIEESERFQETRGRSIVQYAQWESCRNIGKIQGGLGLREENCQRGAGGCRWGSQEAPGTSSRRNRNAILKKRAWGFYGTFFHTNKKPTHALTCLCPIILMAQNLLQTALDWWRHRKTNWKPLLPPKQC